VEDNRLAILFLCTGNSARSILAEGIANHRFGSRLRAHSAGSRPRGGVHELALETLRHHGVPTDGLASKSWDGLVDHSFDVVVTLGDVPGFPRGPDPRALEPPRSARVGGSPADF
jgi:arsenate reductase